jgi:hypothetical protein
MLLVCFSAFVGALASASKSGTDFFTCKSGDDSYSHTHTWPKPAVNTYRKAVVDFALDHFQDQVPKTLEPLEIDFTDPNDGLKRAGCSRLIPQSCLGSGTQGY